MADKSTGGPSKGTTHGGDQTSMPGQAAGGLFAGHNPLSTGASGTGGAAPSPDPTLQVPVPGSVYGAGTDDTDTGAPGTGGTHGGVKTGASYTVDAYGAYSYMDEAGGSVDTEPQGNKYGSDARIPGLSSAYQPKSTGAGGGHPMIGGREVH